MGPRRLTRKVNCILKTWLCKQYFDVLVDTIFQVQPESVASQIHHYAGLAQDESFSPSEMNFSKMSYLTEYKLQNQVIYCTIVNIESLKHPSLHTVNNFALKKNPTAESRVEFGIYCSITLSQEVWQTHTYMYHRYNSPDDLPLPIAIHTRSHQLPFNSYWNVRALLNLPPNTNLITCPLILTLSPAAILNFHTNSFCPLDTARALTF